MQRTPSSVDSFSNIALFEPLEVRQLMSAVPKVDGTGNNVANPLWGSVNQKLLRLVPAAYGDGVSSPAGSTRPSARQISSTVADHGEDETPNDRSLSSFAYLWGQFIDHDLSLTTTGSESFDIAVPKGDPYFDPAGTGTQTIDFNRSNVASGTGTRQQTNTITAYIDASMVYGSDTTRAKFLRTLSGGKMKTSSGNLLPFNTGGFKNDTIGGPASSYFLAGDVRANENIELTAIQTLFVREHNRLATLIGTKNPGWTDEQIYQAAKKIITAEIQKITYEEYLPALLGKPIAPYAGYKSNVNAGISNEFSTAAFRVGHTMVAGDVDFLDNNGNDLREPLDLANAFFNPAVVSANGIDPILKYLATSVSEEIDTKVVDGLRNFLFGPPGAGGFDLVSLNIQRGRDHGLADYNTTREKLGLGRVTSFSQITSDVELSAELQSLYGSVNKIDLWVGGLAEDHAPGSSVGKTFGRIIADQFTRTRDGDRFWYQSNLSAGDLQLVNSTSLADIIRRNSTTTNVQDDVFVYNVQITGRIWDDRNADGRPAPIEAGLAGRVVKLLNSTGVVVETTKTDARGVYLFENVDIGTYRVTTDLPAGSRRTTPAPKPIVVTRGQRFDHVDFGQQRITQQPAPRPQQPKPGQPSPFEHPTRLLLV